MPQLTLAQALQLAVKQHQAGNLAAARSVYEQILKIDPRQADALHLLGMLTTQSGDPQAGAKLIRRAIDVLPTAPAYHDSLGTAQRRTDQLPAAIASFKEAIRLDPKFAVAWANLGSAQRSAGNPADAIVSLRKALELDPKSALSGAIRNELGVALSQINRFDEALKEIETATALDPRSAHAQQNLGLVLGQSGRLPEAIMAFRSAITLAPDLSEAHGNLGFALAGLGSYRDAVTSFRKATELAPKVESNWINLANQLTEIGELDEAKFSLQHAIALAPKNATAHASLANVFVKTASLAEALASFDRAIELEPTNASIHGGRIFARHFYEFHDAPSIYRDAKEWDDRHGKPLAPSVHLSHTPRTDRPLRIGYISPDFTDHVLALLMLPLFTHHDKSQFDVYCYSDVANPTATTERFKRCAKEWRPIVGKSDEEVARQIRADEIDILVDLAMHMRGNRLQVFARKPAPVQITWCYPGTTGLSAIDYRITDPQLDPPGMFDAYYSEKSLYLPDTFFCYDPITDGPLNAQTPAIQNGFITFGCLNNFCKVNETVLKLWARVMSSVKGSKLLILSPRGSARDWVNRILGANGISTERIIHVERQARTKYLEQYNAIDISLDTFPYNGHTTSLDSFWMGVPVVTLVGPSVVGRAGLSELTNLKLTDLVANTPEEFVAIATKLSTELSALQKLREGMRDRFQSSPLMDGERFARAMENAYRKVLTVVAK